MSLPLSRCPAALPALLLGLLGPLLLPPVAENAEPPPPLPELRLELFPEAPRKTIESAYRRAQSEPDDAGAVGALGMALQAWKQWPAAHQAYGRAAALAPGTLDWQYLDGLVLLQLGRPTNAAARFREALEAAPAHLPSRVKLAEALLDAGEHETAETLYANLLKEPAAEPLAAYGLARLAALAGRHEEAAARFRQAIGLFPEFGAAYYGLALAERATGRREEASAALRKHQEYGNRWPAVADPLSAAVAALRGGASQHLERGLKLAEQGDLQGAIAAHEEALEAEPDLAQAHANLISLNARVGDWAAAEKHYRAVLAIGSNLGEAHYDYGVTLGLQQRWDEAEAAYRKAIEVNPRHPQAHNNLGQILERRRQVAEAADHYRQAVQSQPGFRLARFNLGRMLIALDRPADAVETLEPLRGQEDAEAPRYIFALGVAQLRAGRRAEGIETVQRAHELAVAHGQGELAAAIERDLGRLK